MSWRQIVALIRGGADGEDALVRVGTALARTSGAQIEACIFQLEPEISDAERRLPRDIWDEACARLGDDFAAELKRLHSRLQGEDIAWSCERRRGPVRALRALTAEVAIRTDVAIALYPQTSEDWEIFKGALFTAGRPLLLVPRDWSSNTLATHIVLAWRPAREAIRAIEAARPLLGANPEVTLVTVDAATVEPTGGQAAAYLADAGIRAEVRALEAAEDPVAQTLLDECARVGADLLVAGAYGHWRVQERIFGGVTQDLLQLARLPILFAH